VRGRGGCVFCMLHQSLFFRVLPPLSRPVAPLFFFLFFVPDRGAVGDVEGVFQAAEALEAASIEQLKLRLFIRQAMQPLDHQDSHHDLGRIGRPPTLGLPRTRGYPFHRLRQGGEIDNGLNLPKGITQGIHLFCPPIPGKEIVLDGCPACDPLSISPTI
jgi:hypothetical protein